jgi:N-methylhydantoinase A
MQNGVGVSWLVAVDVGGTFTDLVAYGNGDTVALKVASTPEHPEVGVLRALDEAAARGVDPARIERVVHASTIATNALLGQMGLELPRVIFVTTEGFRDVIEIGRQNRSRVYDLFVARPTPLAARGDRIGVRERMDFRGEPLLALADAEIARVVDAVRERAPQSIAVGFLHAYANDDHERRMADALREAFPEVPVTRSSDVDPAYREYERFSTTVVNAALLPIVRTYLENLRAALRERGVAAPIFVMRSDGGLAGIDAAAALPAMLIESGPAGGAIAAASLAREIGAANVLSFDMGGTTAKAGTVADGRVQLANEFEAAGASHSGRAVSGSGYPVRFPFVDLAEISAGGGTIAWIDAGGSLRVGPLSAGADPGPACYGTSDRATVTDANVVLGRLSQTHLLGGTFPIDAARSRAAIEALARRLNRSADETAEGIVALVDAQMAKVLRIVTVERGLDPRAFALIAFGGNGPLHACALADDIGIARIVVPARPGLFSAVGLLHADLRAAHERPLLRATDELRSGDLDAAFAYMEARGRDELRAQGAADERIAFARSADVRYRGQSFELAISADGAFDELAERFHCEHERRYGYAARGETVEVVNARSTVTSPFENAPRARDDAASAPAGASSREVRIAGACQTVPVLARAALAPGATLHGPALVEQYDCVTYVAPGWSARRDADRLELTR